MSDKRAALRASLVAGFVLLAVVGVSRSADAPEPCCFTNSSYAGVCQVVPTQDETCASILAYLNKPTSAGRAYCNSTNIRGGWVQTNCSTNRTTWTR